MSIIKQLRKPRIAGFAIFDFAASFGAAYLISPYVEKYVSRTTLMIGVIPLGIAVHEIFGIDTPLNRLVFGRDKNWKDQLPGGIADKFKPEDFDPKSLKQGQKVEMEHTHDKLTALEIAMDHLAEDPEYYEKLKTIEPHHN